MKKLILLFSLMAIVVMGGCEKENVSPNELATQLSTYEGGTYYDDLGGYVVYNHPYEGLMLIAKKTDEGPMLSAKLSDYNQTDVNVWHAPSLKEMNAISEFQESYAYFGLIKSKSIPEERVFYWYISEGHPMLKLSMANCGGASSAYPGGLPCTNNDDNREHRLRLCKLIQYTPLPPIKWEDR